MTAYGPKALSVLLALRLAAIAMAPQTAIPADRRRPAGVSSKFVVPTASTDQYGNPVERRRERTRHSQSGLPYEIWLKEPRMEFILVPGGTVELGGRIAAKECTRRYGGKSVWWEDEHPRHRVRITRAVYFAKYEVTNAQYAVLDPGHGSGSYRGLLLNQTAQPVCRISWYDALTFCRWLGALCDAKVRLPTEAEWELACRAGTQTIFYWGDSERDRLGYENHADITSSSLWIDTEVWDVYDTYAVSAPVGRFGPNPLGLYDMLGNVREWCSDWYDAAYYTRSQKVDPAGPPDGVERVSRGGAWDWHSRAGRSACRRGYSPDYRGHALGFRCVIEIPGPTLVVRARWRHMASR